MYVAPRAGAWIETNTISAPPEIAMSRPARARGLKLHHAVLLNVEVSRAPRGRVD